MSKKVKILFVDDRVTRFKTMEDCRKTGLLKADVVDCTLPMIDTELDNWNDDDVKQSITKTVQEKMSEHDSHDCVWLVMLDFQLYRRLTDYYHRNELARKAVLDAIWQNENVYLVLYTSAEPELCSDFFEDVCYEMAEPGANTKFKLFHSILVIYFDGTPTNYMYMLKTEVNRAIDSIMEGNLNDEKWIHTW